MKKICSTITIEFKYFRDLRVDEKVILIFDPHKRNNLK